jgi:hypothetical protein
MPLEKVQYSRTTQNSCEPLARALYSSIEDGSDEETDNLYDELRGILGLGEHSEVGTLQPAIAHILELEAAWQKCK